VAPRYGGLLERATRAPRQVVMVAGLAMAGLAVTVATLPQLRQAELPPLDERDLMVELHTTPGTALARMDQIASEVTGKIRSVPGVRNVISHAGRAVTGDMVVDVNSAALWVGLDEGADQPEAVAAIDEVLAGYPEVDSDVRSYQQSRIDEAGAGPQAPVVVRVYGNEQVALNDKAKEVGAELAKIDGIEDLQVRLPVAEPTLEVTVNLERAQRLGVKPGDVRRAAAILLSGIDVGQLFYDQKVFDVVVWGTPATRDSQDDVRNLLVETPNGGLVRLEEVADVRLVDSPDVIEREGVFRRVDVTAEVAGRSRSAVAADVERAISGIDFPLEYRAELLDDSAEQEASQRRSLYLAVFTGLAMLLVLQACFGSWRLGTAFFFSLPLALSGGMLAAVAMDGPVTIGAVLGLLTVLGIVARNGIVLVKGYQVLERREGKPFGVPLVVEGARDRLAPTLMTAVATALVFLPVVVLGSRPGYELLHPLGVTVLGGLVTGTLVSLFLVPLLYLLMATSRSETEQDISRFEDELMLMDSGGNIRTEQVGPVATAGL
jgi:Cu/Ag efflux pump CusA